MCILGCGFSFFFKLNVFQPPAEHLSLILLVVKLWVADGVRVRARGEEVAAPHALPSISRN
jgi:hypothetical protein